MTRGAYAMNQTDRRACLISILLLLGACTHVPVATNEAKRSPTSQPTPIRAQPTAITANGTTLTGRFAYNTPDGNLWAVDAASAQRVQLTRAGGNDYDP